MKTDYYLLDPTGNITALVTNATDKNLYNAVASYIFKNHTCTEQVGFVDFKDKTVKLSMSGGEFCGNATMSTAALYCYINGIDNLKTDVYVSGTDGPVKVNVKRKNEVYKCDCVLKKPKSIIEYKFSKGSKEYTFPLVCFDSIMHIVADESLDEKTAREVIKGIARDLSASALGIMMYNAEKRQLTPLVYVPKVDTLFVENSCASGSCAVAQVKGFKDGETAIIQPGGTLSVKVCKSGIKLSGNVKIINHYSEDMGYAEKDSI